MEVPDADEVESHDNELNDDDQANDDRVADHATEDQQDCGRLKRSIFLPMTVSRERDLASAAKPWR